MCLLNFCPYTHLCKPFALFNHQTTEQMHRVYCFSLLCVFVNHILSILLLCLVVRILLRGITKFCHTPGSLKGEKRQEKNYNTFFFIVFLFFFFNLRHTWKYVIFFIYNFISSQIVIPLKSEGQKLQILNLFRPLFYHICKLMYTDYSNIHCIRMVWPLN